MDMLLAIAVSEKAMCLGNFSPNVFSSKIIFYAMAKLTEYVKI